jgi:phage tail sheath protein FI
MPVQVSYPGVYVEEVSSGVRTIAGVSTSRTAFVGRALMGPLNEPTLIFSFADYQRIFGGLWSHSSMSFAVQQYFDNGGAEAVIVRVANGALTSAAASLNIEASSPGKWGDSLSVGLDTNTRPGDPTLVNLTVLQNTVLQNNVEVETLRNVSLPDIKATLEQRSQFIRLLGNTAPARTPTPPVPLTGGDDGSPVDAGALLGIEANRTGMFALLKTDIFNLLCLPPPDDTSLATDYDKAAKFCADHRAMLLVDPASTATNPGNVSIPTITDKKNAAFFFPRLLALNPLSGMIEEFVPSGAVAGVFARTDAQRGVWKAPAGTEAGLTGAVGLSYTLTDPENGVLNKKAINCLRNFAVIGNVVWGSRTVDGDDSIGSEWKYIPVRRLALYIEESLFRGLKWVVFEPNDAPLWAQIRLNVGAFMNNLFRQGAFQGSSPRDAYFVKCDSETTTQNDINLGIVNILVGFAPLKPAEFVIIKIQQIAGQIQV